MALFVSASELQTHLQKTLDADQADSAIESAQEVIRADLGSRAVLDAEAVTAKMRLLRPRDSLELPVGPVLNLGAVASVDVAGTAFDLADAELPHPWMLRRLDGNYFPANGLITIKYTAGFSYTSAGDSDMPSQLKRAILMLAGTIYSNPDTQKVRERIGDWEAEYKGIAGNQGDPDSLTLPGQVKLLLRPWRNPRI